MPLKPMTETEIHRAMLDDETTMIALLEGCKLLAEHTIESHAFRTAGLYIGLRQKFDPGYNPKRNPNA